MQSKTQSYHNILTHILLVISIYDKRKKPTHLRFALRLPSTNIKTSRTIVAYDQLLNHISEFIPIKYTIYIKHILKDDLK